MGILRCSMDAEAKHKIIPRLSALASKYLFPDVDLVESVYLEEVVEARHGHIELSMLVWKPPLTLS